MNKLPRLATLKPRVQTQTPRVQTSRVRERMPGSAWQKVRERILRANPLCVMCQSEGKLAPAVEVDHKVPIHLGGSDDDVNLQGLCAPHHRSKLINELSTLYGKAR